MKIANTHKNRHSASLLVRKRKIKTIKRHNSYTSPWLKQRKPPEQTENVYWWQWYGVTVIYYTVSRMINGYSHIEILLNNIIFINSSKMHMFLINENIGIFLVYIDLHFKVITMSLWGKLYPLILFSYPGKLYHRKMTYFMSVNMT
jgi:hypothetical protein